MRNYWYENMMSPIQSFACDFHDFHGKRFAIVTKTYGTTQIQNKIQTKYFISHFLIHDSRKNIYIYMADNNKVLNDVMT